MPILRSATHPGKEIFHGMALVFAGIAHNGEIEKSDYEDRSLQTENLLRTQFIRILEQAVQLYLPERLVVPGSPPVHGEIAQPGILAASERRCSPVLILSDSSVAAQPEH